MSFENCLHAVGLMHFFCFCDFPSRPWKKTKAHISINYTVIKKTLTNYKQQQETFLFQQIM